MKREAKLIIILVLSLILVRIVWAACANPQTMEIRVITPTGGQLGTPYCTAAITSTTAGAGDNCPANAFCDFAYSTCAFYGQYRSRCFSSTMCPGADYNLYWCDYDACPNCCESGTSYDWALAGEIVGQYSAVNTQWHCCGDDAGENYVQTAGNPWRCCNSPNDCVQAGGGCVGQWSCLGGAWLCGGVNWQYCPIGATDSDGNNPTVAGTCNANDGCADANCASDSYPDVCTSTTQLTEYYDGGSVCSSTTYNCGDFEVAASGETADNPATTSSCTGGTGASCSGGRFTTTSGSSGTDRCVDSSVCFSNGGPGGGNCDFREYYDSDSSDSCPGQDRCVSRDYNPDTNSNTCSTCVGGSRWNIGGEVAGSTCCGDDSGEYRKQSSGYPDACCNSNSDCSYTGSVCRSAGTCQGNLLCGGVSQSQWQTCPVGASDSDGNNPSVAGTCSEDSGCSGGSCQSNNYADTCTSGTALTEYYDGGSVCSSTTYNCGDFEVAASGETADNPATTSSCTGGTGASCSGNRFTTTSGSSGTDRCVDSSVCFSNGGPGGGNCDFREYYDSDSSDSCPGQDRCVSRDYNPDTNSNTCSTCVGGGRWNIGGEISNCCGDDSGEYRVQSSGNPAACCNSATDCTDSAGNCVSINTCSGNSRCIAGNQFSSCPTGASDSDGDNPSVAGTCSDNDGCSGGACTSTDYDDLCTSGTALTEYYDGGSVCSSKTYNCGDFEVVASGETADNPATTSSCTGGTGASCSGGRFTTTSGSSGNDRCVDSSVCYANGGPGGGNCDFREYYDTDSSDSCPGQDRCVSRDYDPDTNSNTCNECVGAGRWAIGGEIAAGNCCGDDANEDRKSCVESMAWGCIGSSTCCSGSGDCTYNDACYNNNQCPTLFGSGTNDHDAYCAGGTWRDADSGGNSARCTACDLTYTNAGESGVGEYADQVTDQCCGDDNNEVLISGVCCNNGGDCVDAGGNCRNNVAESTFALCTNAIDDNCDGECDYDNTWCAKGDPDCTIQVMIDPIILDSSPDEGDTITVQCTYNVGGISSAEADIDGVDCGPIQGWIGNTATFNCNVGNAADPPCPTVKQANCGVDTSISYQAGGDRALPIDVHCSSCTNYIQADCGTAPPGCQWCVDCQNNQYTGSASACISSSASCSRSCIPGICGALCDGDEDCLPSESCQANCVCVVTGCDPDLYAGPECCDDNEPSSLTPSVNVQRALGDFVNNCGGGSCYGVGFPDSGSDYNGQCCQDDNNEDYKWFDVYVGSCSDVGNEDCVGQNDNTGINACCNNVNDCIDLGGNCRSDGYLADLDGDGIAGEFCMSSDDRWRDCDGGSSLCTGTCSFSWIPGGESSAFGEYDTGTATECCEDDSGEFAIGGACCDTVGDCVDAGGVCRNNQAENTVALCTNNIDDNCDNKCDYDGPGSCTKGDSGCPVNPIAPPIVSDSSPMDGDTIQVQCTYNVGSVNSAQADIGGASCGAVVSWNGNIATFNCGVGAAGDPPCPTSKTVTCGVDTTISYQTLGDQITSINIHCLNCGNYPQGTCNGAPAGCEWCVDCQNNQYSGSASACISDSPGCSRSCVDTICGAGCDDNLDCLAGWVCNLGDCQCEQAACDPDLWVDEECCDNTTSPPLDPTINAINPSWAFDLGSCGGGTCYGMNFPDGASANYDNPCCGDDSSEYYEQCAKEAAVSWSCAGAGACCDSTSCVYNSVCYNDAQCYTRGSTDDKEVSCASGSWRDLDFSQGTCTGCGYDWVQGGESAAFGEYITGGATDCCEDDANEFYTTGLGSPRCCGSNNMCIDGNDACQSGSEDCSLNSGDEDCDTETDWDNTDGIHGDDDCEVEVTAITIPDPNPVESSSFRVGCTSNVGGIQGVSAIVVGEAAVCQWDQWIGNVAWFDCIAPTAGSCPEARTVRCYVDETKSYKKGTDKTGGINVGCSSCDNYEDSGLCSGAPAGCEWCVECNPAFPDQSNGLEQNKCVDQNTCNDLYRCRIGNCTAVCDDTVGGCGTGDCNDFSCACDSISCNPDTYGNANCCDNTTGLIPDIDTDYAIPTFDNTCGSGGGSCYGVGFPELVQPSNYELQCCGDDTLETYEECAKDAAIAWACSGDTDACCPNTACIYGGGNCYDNGACGLNLNPGSNDASAYCSAGSWADFDNSQSDCTGCGLSWDRAGSGIGVGEYTDTLTNECCGDDNNEAITACSVTASVAWGCPATSACCNGASCEYNDVCYNFGTCTQLRASGADMYASCLGSGEWIDTDANAQNCTACGLPYASTGETLAFGEYGVPPDSGCCGDDPDEFVNMFNLTRDGCNDITDEGCLEDGVILDNSSDTACCDNSTDCVWGGQCYPAGDGPYDFDLDGYDEAYCRRNGGDSWLDCDVFSSSCESTSCNNLQWLGGGEAPLDAFGEYDTGDATECCGDDAGENNRFRQVQSYSEGISYNVIASDNTDRACCADPDSCVYLGKCYMDRHDAIAQLVTDCGAHGTNMMNCQADPDCEYSAGYCNMTRTDTHNYPSVWNTSLRDQVFEDINGDGIREVCDPGEWIDPNTDQELCEDMGGFWLGTTCCGEVDPDPDCDGTFYGNVKDVDGLNVPNATIRVIGTSRLFPGRIFNYTTFTDPSGDYNVLVIGNSTYDLVASKPYFVSDAVINQYIQMMFFKEINFTLVSTYEQCQADCTYTDDEYCHAGCDGRVGCQFDDAQTMAICNGKISGWVVEFNSTHEVICCEGAPFKRRRFRVVGVRVGPEIENLVRLIRVVILRGKPTKMIIDTFQ